MRNRGISPGSCKDERRQERVSDSSVPGKLTDVCARFADICDYFSRQRIDLPPKVLEAISSVSKLPVTERIARMNQLNQELIEYVHTVSQDSGIRH